MAETIKNAADVAKKLSRAVSDLTKHTGVLQANVATFVEDVGG